MLPRGEKTLLVASTGGHLAQLLLVARMLDLHADSLWVTFDSPQSRSLLHDRRATFVPYIRPRGFLTAARTLPRFDRLLRAEAFSAVLSTGAAVAGPALLTATARHVPAYYLESISRYDGPSLTGRMVARLPGVRCYTQHRGWAGGRWSYDLSIADHLTARRPRVGAGAPGSGSRARVFVTLGTIAPYRFDALVDNLVRVLPAGADVTWQLGCTTRWDLPGTVHEVVSVADFDRLATDADLVVSHAGVGSALRMLDLGVRPLLVPRRSARGEHVDDHQLQAARELERAGLLPVREAGAITAQDVRRLLAGDDLPPSPEEPRPPGAGRHVVPQRGRHRGPVHRGRHRVR